jgi:hypothetical protein
MSAAHSCKQCRVVATLDPLDDLRLSFRNGHMGLKRIFFYRSFIVHRKFLPISQNKKKADNQVFVFLGLCGTHVLGQFVTDLFGSYSAIFAQRLVSR